MANDFFSALGMNSRAPAPRNNPLLQPSIVPTPNNFLLDNRTPPSFNFAQTQSPTVPNPFVAQFSYGQRPTSLFSMKPGTDRQTWSFIQDALFPQLNKGYQAPSSANTENTSIGG